MKLLLPFLAFSCIYSIKAQEPAVKTQTRGNYYVQAAQNNLCTEEEKEALNKELKIFGAKVMEKLRLLLLKNKGLLNLAATKEPILKIMCEWGNVEIEAPQQ